jgi:hypothetical protein
VSIISDGVSQMLLEKDSKRTITGLDWQPSGEAVVVSMKGEMEGIWGLGLTSGEMAQWIAAKDPRAVRAFAWDGAPHVSWLGSLYGRDAVFYGRPMREVETEAWQDGPRSLLAHVRTWQPVQQEVSRVVRCRGEHEVSLRLESDGGVLRWGSGVEVAVWSAAMLGEDLVQFFGLANDGTPWIVAELRRDASLSRLADAWMWVDQTGQTVLPASAWLPAGVASELPLGSDCREN